MKNSVSVSISLRQVGKNVEFKKRVFCFLFLAGVELQPPDAHSILGRHHVRQEHRQQGVHQGPRQAEEGQVPHQEEV